ncbi:hypothetical protein H8J16_28835, partial [Klebsiella pneumoniae]|nr:hypothetical protein [Klebsiella pneumoniae]
VLTPEAAVAARSGHGGTAPLQVQAQLERLQATVAAQRQWTQQAVLPSAVGTTAGATA